MKIVMPGGSGQVGTLLARAFQRDGHEVVVLSRKAYAAPWRVVAWDAESIGYWADEMDGADVVINLAGRSVNCRYTPENRRLILDSRVLSTRAVDGGNPIAASADDGLFDSTNEPWTLTLSALSSGQHKIEVQALDQAGNKTTQTVSVTVP